LQTGRPSLTRNTEWQASWFSSDVSCRTLISTEGGSRHNNQTASTFKQLLDDLLNLRV
jgi:hypothetical protein